MKIFFFHLIIKLLKKQGEREVVRCCGNLPYRIRRGRRNACLHEKFFLLLQHVLLSDRFSWLNLEKDEELWEGRRARMGSAWYLRASSHRDNVFVRKLLRAVPIVLRWRSFDVVVFVCDFAPSKPQQRYAVMPDKLQTKQGDWFISTVRSPIWRWKTKQEINKSLRVFCPKGTRSNSIWTGDELERMFFSRSRWKKSMTILTIKHVYHKQIDFDLSNMVHCVRASTPSFDSPSLK